MPNTGRVYSRSLGGQNNLFIAIMGWSIGTLFQGFANGLVSLFTLRAVTGMFEAPAFPTNNRIVTSWFPEQERASAVGFYTSGQFVGLAFLTPLLIWLQEKTSWHWVFIVTGAIGILWALIWHFAYQAPRKASSPIRPRLTILLTVVVWLMATLRQEKRDCAFNDGRLEAGVSSQVSGGLYWPVRHCLNAMVFPNLVPELPHSRKAYYRADRWFYDNGAVYGCIFGVILSGIVADKLLKSGKSIGLRAKLLLSVACCYPPALLVRIIPMTLCGL